MFNLKVMKMKNKAAFLKEENLLTLLSQNNFIVPEIQREYVWGNNEKVIRGFFTELKNKIGEGCSECHQPHSQNKINIGFLYSYKPEYVQLKQQRFLDENLIDGQQRFTTLFLLLFYCALKENRKKDFLALIRFQEKLSMSFDFKVRDLTRRFLLEFVEKINNVYELMEIKEQTWFLVDYKNDVSIKAILKSLEYICEDFKNDTKYYQYLLSNIVFWHFKTEVTSQGEELYITMNARGEELADNEITKAALMLEGQELLESGQKWETWQQFFWKHRNKASENPSADNGFNSFLECIAGFESFQILQNQQEVKKDIRQLLNIELVEKYYNALKFLEDNKDKFKQDYPNYNLWVDIALRQIWDFFNNREVDWFTDHTDRNKGTELSKMVYVWSVLSYILTSEEKKKLDVRHAFRFLRIYYLKYHNYDRSVTGINQNVNTALDKGPWGIDGTKEEQNKHKFFNELRVSDEIVKEFEQLIWQIEDHELNLKGRDLAFVNISHLVNFADEPTKEDLENIRDSFDALFPNNKTKGSSLLKSTLLFKGSFWKDTSPGYYKRYNFSEWKKHIRTKEFAEFFKEFKESNNDLECIFKKYREIFLESNKIDINNASNVLPEPDIRTRFCYYAILLEPASFWENGEHIAIYHNLEVGTTRLFENESNKIYNSKGHFKGHTGNTDLWEASVKLYNKPIDHLKSLVEELV